MKTWKNAEIVEVSIKETASGSFHTGTEGEFTHDKAHCDKGREDNFLTTVSDFFGLETLFGWDPADLGCNGVATNTPS